MVCTSGTQPTIIYLAIAVACFETCTDFVGWCVCVCVCVYMCVCVACVWHVTIAIIANNYSQCVCANLPKQVLGKVTEQRVNLILNRETE